VNVSCDIYHYNSLQRSCYRTLRFTAYQVLSVLASSVVVCDIVCVISVTVCHSVARGVGAADRNVGGSIGHCHNLSDWY